ncbi:ABC transporter ATP-binding protein [Isachenkonia alkalipeptolytica]|uniref:ABC transporter ATP-binding protein n=1 Tax=Isachenkonia alkalipeptolytica TaxID=2565777 RepID=A0AA43XJY8_9CLOT|nr:ABC transporter ATP-binding protein [Isachenkonia alkalipeptolytica]NBG87651.1 ABC transporter ATP-binding protein [Isachenkonia alkalipeptolytica]
MFKVENLHFTYPKNKEETIKGLDFEIQQGEIFGLLGPSGVGKSTTQKILIKILRDFDGSITYKGKNLKDYGRDFYEEIGVGFEVPVHFSKLTAMENLEFFMKLYKNHEAPEELLKKLGLYEDRNKKIAEFSRGMKIRMNFVKALLNKPKMLFLDEPTAGLDPKNARIIKNLIREYREQGGTVILTTHLMNDVEELCDRVAFMAEGKIVEINSPKNLKLQHGERQVEVEYEKEGKMENRVFSLDGLHEDEEFFQVVKNHRIITMHSKETTLDDIFIEITGGEHREKS